MEGQYVIGVIGYTNSTFLLTVLYEENKVVEMVSGIKHEFTIKNLSTIYIEYFHASSDSFTIDNLIEVGETIILANPYNKNQDYAKALPTVQNSTWKSAAQHKVKHDKLTI